MRSTPIAALLAACLLGGLPACSSDDKPSKSASSSSAATVSAADLAQKMQDGIRGVQSETMTLNATLLGNKINGTGPARFAKGELDAVDLKGEIEGSGKLRVVLLDDQAYAQVPDSFNNSGKPWLLVDPDSSNVVAAQLGKALDGIKSAASLNNLVTLVKASATLESKGAEKVGGADAEHYVLTVDAAKLPAKFKGKDDFAGPLKGSKIEVWVDADGRPVKIVRTVIVSGQQVPITLAAGDFNKDVTITAPPKGDIFTG